jgi:iron complex outermembrane receptor protein
VLALEPEEQAGFEVGADLRVGSRLAFSLVRYDQEARNLIQPVAFSVGARGRSTVVTRHENVGAIGNKGWELEGRYAVGALTLTTAMGLTDSRVRQVAEGYTGELRAGDRVLQVPARTLSVGASWMGRGWSSSMTLARASDWMNYNWLELSLQPDLTGASLRDFWLRYPGVTRMRVSVTRDLTRTIGLSVSGDNLLNRQRGEPDNLTIVPGRTLRAGLRARFL